MWPERASVAGKGAGAGAGAGHVHLSSAAVRLSTGAEVICHFKMGVNTADG